MLAWALGLAELPPYDRLVETHELLSALAFLDDGNAREILASASLRPADDLERFKVQIFAYHWRMVDYRVNGTATDYARVQFDPESLDVSLRAAGRRRPGAARGRDHRGAAGADPDDGELGHGTASSIELAVRPCASVLGSPD